MPSDMPQIVNFPRDTTMQKIAESLDRIAENTAASASASVAEFGDAAFSAMLDDTNTTELFKKWWALNAKSEDSKWDKLVRWFGMLKNDHTYTWQFYSHTVSGDSTGTPMHDLVGKGAGKLKTDADVLDNTDWTLEDRFTWYVRANATSNADGTMNILAVEGVDSDFDVSGHLAPVYAFQQSLCVRRWEKDGYYYKSFRSYPIAGMYLPDAEDVAPDGTFRPLTWHACFVGSKVDKGGKTVLTSGSGLQPAIYTSAAAGLNLARAQSPYDGLTNDCDAIFFLEQWQLRHGTLENSGYLEGCTTYYLKYNCAVPETGVNRIIVTTADGANLVEGSYVTVGTTERAQGDYCKIISKETVEIEGQNYTAINVDKAEAFDTTAETLICTMPWYTGSTEAVPGHHDGCCGSLTNGKYPMRVAGIELLTGCYEIQIEPLWDVTNPEEGVWRYTAYACRDSEQLAGSITANHKEVGHYDFHATSYVWLYIKAVQNSSEFLLPDAVGGSSASYYRSAFYVYPAVSLRAPWRRCHLHYGGYAGLSGAVGYYSVGAAYWYGAPRLAGAGKKRGEWAA